jgi:general stress protein 26
LPSGGSPPTAVEDTVVRRRIKKMRDASKTIGNLIDKVNISIISSIDEDGFPNSKAMLPPRKREGIKYIFFTTNTSSMRVRQYHNNPKACLYFFDKRFFKGVMLKGTMEVLQDSASKEMIWKDGDEMYYPKGVTDPDYCVLKFTVQSGRYYSNFKSENFEIG